MPAMFIGHGSPMNVIEQNDFTRSLEAIARKIPVPRAILVVSAHWLTEGSFVTAMSKPRQIYDFYGFPDELYEVTYRPKGSPEDAAHIEELGLEFPIRHDFAWGLDHASWAVLKHMYPDQNIPVLELSLDMTRSEGEHYRIGTELSELRDRGVLIIGSGNIVHNLRRIDFENRDAKPFEWAVAFDHQVKEALQGNRFEDLIHYKGRFKLSELAVPTNDHYLPLLYVVASKKEEDEVLFFYEGFQNRSMSMRSLLFGHS
jgi:4,5-DOPA dioxygenase extradiol